MNQLKRSGNRPFFLFFYAHWPWLMVYIQDYNNKDREQVPMIFTYKDPMPYMFRGKGPIRSQANKILALHNEKHRTGFKNIAFIN